MSDTYETQPTPDLLRQWCEMVGWHQEDAAREVRE